ncbi:class I SAM-dependent methyltransferase [Patescibacteria group bacterium]|nr:class I SAM-dependent methyltransferase [Patescibacteria group bacterium]
MVQLGHNYDLTVLYGDNYGYRSGLNKSMVRHLASLAEKIKEKVEIKKGDIVVDIASNDGTLLQSYQLKGVTLVGIDPTIKKFKSFYTPDIQTIPDFFSAKAYKKKLSKKAKVVTSIAMFYDLENPISFMEEIKEILADDGVWVFEQSYMPDMLKNVSYDTICHEHLEYYALSQIKWMTDRVGLKIIDVELNDSNGASFCVTVAKQNSSFRAKTEVIEKILQQEEKAGINQGKTYKLFEKNVKKHKKDLAKFIVNIKKKNLKILGYGASTKGNVILQYCNITSDDIPFIADVNEYKHGRFTPGTKIPIISEQDAKAMNPDYFLVLPWHFKKNFLEREKEYLKRGGHLFFPLPKLDVV